MDASLYHPLFFGFFCLWGGLLALRYRVSYGYALIQKQESLLWGWGLSIFVAIWLGMRPISARYFGDMSSYARMYNNLSPESLGVNLEKEWLWDNLGAICHILNFSTQMYFVVVTLIYTLCAFATLRILIPKKSLTSLVLICGSLMFFSFATNGLRNGLACHISMLAFALFLKDKKISGVLLAFLAYGTHHSVGIPIAAFVASLFIYKRPHWALYIWLLSIIASLFLGNSVTGFIEQLSTDDRLSQYTSLEQGGLGTTFSRYGFRWDFLLYSAIPIALGYYTIIKRRITDNWYSVFFSTYCFANAFWVIFIRAAFSNRFAYLSWFLYPVMIAYPLFILNIWPNQDKNIGLIMMLYVGFTAFMQFLYW
jgi:hypothetical protein